MSSKTIFLNDTIYEYFKNISLREPAVLANLREKTALLHEARMQICPEQGQLMAMLVKLINAKNILEIGTFTGYSSTAMALAMSADGQLDTLDCDDKNTKIAIDTWEQAKVSKKINLHIDKALNTLDILLKIHGESFYDLIFIDADKSNYDAYYELSLKLVRIGGLILIDNTLWYGKVADEVDQEKSTLALRALNLKLHQDARVELSMLPIGDGLTLLMRR